MTDLNWCTFCDSAISPYSESLYCSEHCLRSDALRNHPLLGYKYPEFIDFPRPDNNTKDSSSHSHSHNTTTMTSCNGLSTPISPTLTATTSTSISSSSINNYDLSSSPPFKYDFLLSTMTSLPPITSIITAKPDYYTFIKSTTTKY
ncbi:uncharacterized protein BX663DRAFT_521654 [Cokeromyces recurvatus]|uniref:uncharacterized protein n=1 Tax=Cokeromyces recurvatus TaxID=90255 RepID=UPI0022203B64|nr:uncharacterized protein BX663DRAFT_521654 [Cokeromyces recurvatus]KAI7899412.1 hypothetical protein BX663DRAFT_521654 [Cokeromyces recurvatus]